MVRPLLIAGLALGLAACANTSTSTALDREERAAQRSGMTCWVEREAGDTSGVYCGDASLAPTGPNFVRWITQPERTTP